MFDRLITGKVALSILSLTVWASVACIAQPGKSVVIGTLVDRPSALMVLNPPGRNQGMLIPQLTTLQRLAMRPTSPDEDGLLLFDITVKSFYFWKDNAWVMGLGTNTTSSDAASGDLSGAYPAPNVSKLQGNAVAPVTLSVSDAGKQLIWSGTQWVPQAASTPGVVSKYVMIDPAEFTNLRRGDKKDKDNIIMFDDNSTYVTTIKKDEGPKVIAPLQLPDGATIEEVTLYYMDREVNNVGFNLYRKSPTGGNESVINSWSSSGSSGAIQTSVHTPIAGTEAVNNGSYSYRIVVSLDQSNDVNNSSDANLRLYAVKVKYLP